MGHHRMLIVLVMMTCRVFAQLDDAFFNDSIFALNYRLRPEDEIIAAAKSRAVDATRAEDMKFRMRYARETERGRNLEWDYSRFLLLGTVVQERLREFYYRVAVSILLDTKLDSEVKLVAIEQLWYKIMRVV